MKTRGISTLLFVLFLIPVLMLPFNATAVQGLSGFSSDVIYNGEYSDVAGGDWYYEYIAGAFELGVFSGSHGDSFFPEDKISIAEIIKIAAVIHKSYYQGSAFFETHDIWYAPYVEYAQMKGILFGDYKNYNAEATRADVAVLLANALPEEALTSLKDISDGAVPDVFENYSYGSAVYKLYRAGVLVGADKDGRFFPLKSMKRSEAAAVVSRLLNPDMRKPSSLTAPLTPSKIFTDCSPAVFFLEVFDDDGEVVKTGSGFFIDSSGIAVTNFHVISGARSADVTLSDGTVLSVSAMLDFDSKKDLALIQVDGDDFPALTIGDADVLLTGETIYTIGSPLGMQNTFSKGIVSGIGRNIKEMDYIQLDAFISSGSSGGALLDSSGRVIGVTSAAVDGGQSLNLAIPISHINTLDRLSPKSLKEDLDVGFYSNFDGAPDFGAFAGVEAHVVKDMGSIADYTYLASELPRDAETLLFEYTELLSRCLFTFSGNYLVSGYEFSAYYNNKYDVLIMVGINVADGEECITVSVS